MAVSEVTIKYAARGAKAAQRADKNVRDSIKETARTARKQSGQIRQWMQRHKTALLAIGAATAAAMGMIIKASPELSAQLASVRLGFSLLAMTLGSDLAPATEGIGSKIIDLADAFAELDPKVRKPISAFIALAGIAAVLIPVIAAVETLIAGTVIGSALAAAASAAVGALGTLAAFLTGPVIIAILAVIAIVAGLYLAWKNNWFGIRDIVFSALESIKAFLSNAFAFIKGVVMTVLTFVWGYVKGIWTAILGVWKTHSAAIRTEISETFAVVRSVVMTALSVVAAIVRTYLKIVFKVAKVYLAILRKAWSVWGDEIMAVARLAFTVIKAVITGALDTILTLIRVTLNVIQGDWGEAWDAIEGYVKRTKKRILSILDAWLTTLDEWFGDLADDALQWGKDLLSNFISGIKAKAAAAANAAKDAAGKVKEHLSFDNVQNDRMAQRWGKDLIDHFSKGMQRNRSALGSALPEQNSQGFGLQPGRGAAAGGGGGQVIDITIEEGAIQMRGSGNSAVDTDRLAREVSSEISDSFGRQ